MPETSTDNDDADITSGALDYISRAVPEHAPAIRQLFSDYSIRVRLTPDIEFRRGQPVDCSPSAIFSVIQWPPIMYTLMWLLAHGAWEVMRDYGSVILTAYHTGALSVTSAEIEKAALGLGASDKGLRAIDCAVRTARGEVVALPDWLPNISDPENVQHAAVRELWLLAIVWMLLHELQHILIRQKNIQFDVWLDEELACDEAASTWLLSDLERYSVSSKQAAEKVRGKRAMGAIIGLFCVGWLSDRDQSSTHPPIFQRLAILINALGETDAGLFWSFAAGLIYVLDRNREKVDFPHPCTIRDVVLALAEGLTAQGR